MSNDNNHRYLNKLSIEFSELIPIVNLYFFLSEKISDSSSMKYFIETSPNFSFLTFLNNPAILTFSKLLRINSLC